MIAPGRMQVSARTVLIPATGPDLLPVSNSSRKGKKMSDIGEHVSTASEAASDADWSADKDGAGMNTEDAVASAYDDWDRGAHGISESERAPMGQWLQGHADHIGLSVEDGLKSVIGPAAVLHNGSQAQKRELLGSMIDEFQIHPEPSAETAQYDEFGDPVGGAPMQSAGQVIQTAEQAAPGRAAVHRGQSSSARWAGAGTDDRGCRRYEVKGLRARFADDAVPRCCRAADARRRDSCTSEASWRNGQWWRQVWADWFTIRRYRRHCRSGNAEVVAMRSNAKMKGYQSGGYVQAIPTADLDRMTSWAHIAQLIHLPQTCGNSLHAERRPTSPRQPPLRDVPDKNISALHLSR